LTVRGIQNDIDHDILSHIVSKKKQRKQITTNQKQLEKMAGTYVTDLDDEEEEDDDDDEMFQHGDDPKKKKKTRRKGRPRSNILCLTSCMQGQLSRYGDLIHGVQPANTVLGLHLCAAFCGRTIHQQAMERRLIQRRTNARKQQEDQEQREHRQSEEQKNLIRQSSSSNNEMTKVQRPALPPRFQIKTETDEVYINHDNEIVYNNRYAQKDGQDALKRGLRADVLLCGIRK